MDLKNKRFREAPPDCILSDIIKMIIRKDDFHYSLHLNLDKMEFGEFCYEHNIPLNRICIRISNISLNERTLFLDVHIGEYQHAITIKYSIGKPYNFRYYDIGKNQEIGQIINDNINSSIELLDILSKKIVDVINEFYNICAQRSKDINN